MTEEQVVACETAAGTETAKDPADEERRLIVADLRELAKNYAWASETRIRKGMAPMNGESILLGLARRIELGVHHGDRERGEHRSGRDG